MCAFRPLTSYSTAQREPHISHVNTSANACTQSKRKHKSPPYRLHTCRRATTRQHEKGAGLTSFALSNSADASTFLWARLATMRFDKSSKSAPLSSNTFKEAAACAQTRSHDQHNDLGSGVRLYVSDHNGAHTRTHAHKPAQANKWGTCT